MVRFIQTDEQFNVSQLSASAGSSKTNTGTLFLVPTQSGGTNSLSKSVWGESANKADNKPNKINCSTSGWMLCTATIQLPETFTSGANRSDSNTYLLVSIPYGTPETDVSIETFTKNGTSEDDRRDFSGVQARIDSTGRANDLYRRVETRVELVDTYFAYPEFEITLTNSSSDVLKKTFHATFDCWGANNGTKFGCDNSDEDDGYGNF